MTTPADPRRVRTGFWQNPAWTEGHAGTFAVIIGVSRYPNLTPARPRAGLNGGLAVSASTAFDFHRWLSSSTNGFAWPAAPLARTWLLLAPTDDELATRAELAAARYGTPTFDAMDETFSDWYFSLKELPKPAADASCGIVFFSGHGVSYAADSQLLLPTDWPDPQRANPDVRAPQTTFLIQGTSVLPPRHFLYFIDACWNSGGAKVGSFRTDGTPILPLPADSALKTRNQRQAVLFAAAEGSQTLQPSDPRQGISVFGEALLASLRMPGGTPTNPAASRDGLEPVGFASLVADVSIRVQALLREKVLVNEESPVSDGGNGVSLTYATWRPLAVPRADGPPVPPPPPSADDSYPVQDPRTWGPHGDYDNLHDLVLHESISWPLMGIRLYRADGGEQLAGASVTVHDVRRGDGSSPTLVRCTLRIDAAAGDDPLWMVLADHTQPQTAWATMLPLGAATDYTVRFRQDPENGPNTLQANFAIALDGPGALGRAVAAWTHRREQSASPSIDLVTPALHPDASPATVVAAELIASLRLPGDAGGLTPDQLRELWITHGSADGLVLYAAGLIDEGSHDRTEIDAILDDLTRLGLPRLNDVAELLDGIALRRRHRIEPLPIEPWLSAVGRVRVRGRMLTGYAGSVGRLGPWLTRPANWTAIAHYASDVYQPLPAGLPTGDDASVRLPTRFPPLSPVGATAYRALAVAADTAGTVAGGTGDLARRANSSVETITAGIAELMGRGVLAESVGPAPHTLRLTNPPPPVPSAEWWSDTG